MAATHPMRLRSGRSIWQSRRLPPVPHQPLTRDLATDVLVIGAGISGAMVADALSEAGLAVLIVDRRGPVAGSTAASTALLQYEIDTPLSKLSKQIGQERAERIWRRSRLALEALRARVRQLGIDADCVERDSLYLQGDVLDEDALRDEADARRRAGLEVTFLDGRPGQGAVRHRAPRRDPRLPQPHRRSAPAGGRLPARRARPRGAAVVAGQGARRRAAARRRAGGDRRRPCDSRAPCRVRDRLRTAEGRAAQRAHHRLHLGAGDASAARETWPERCTIWEASDPYLYLRVRSRWPHHLRRRGRGIFGRG